MSYGTHQPGDGQSQDMSGNIGIEVDSFSNEEGNLGDLFTSFHKSQKEGKENKLGGEGQQQSQNNSGEEGEGEGEGQEGKIPAPKKKVATTTTAQEPKIDENLLNTLIKKHVTGKDDEEESEGEGEEGEGQEGKEGKNKNIAPVPEGSFKILHDHFIDKMGYEPLSDDEGAFDGSEEKFIEFQEKNMRLKSTQEAEAMVLEAFNKNPANKELGLDLFRHLINGGDIQTFTDTRQHEDITPEFITAGADDAEKEARAEKVMVRYYQTMGWKTPDIDKVVKTLKTGGTLLAVAETTLPQFIALKETRKAIADQSVITQKANNDKAVKEFNTKLFSIIDEGKPIGGFTLTTKKEKDTLKQYMFVPTVDTGNGKLITQYQADKTAARSNPAYMLIDALVHLKKGLDVTNIKNKAAQEQKQTLKDNLDKLASGKKLEQPGTGANTKTNNRPISEILDFDNIQFA